MTITKTYLENKFNKYNNEYFGGKLIMPTFRIINTYRRLGQYRGRTNTISISTYFDRDEKGFDQTLIHEMIHEWQWQTYRHVDHGNTFKAKAREINRYGWDISRLTNIGDAPVKAENRKVVYVVYGKAKDGSIHIGRVKHGYEDSIMNMLSRYHGYTDLHIGKTCHPMFLSRTESRTTFHWSKATKQDIFGKFNVEEEC